jgi:hypothetical protein
MEIVKALLTLRYRPLSDTVIASVDALEAEPKDESSVPDLNAGVVRERLDADTTAEWIYTSFSKQFHLLHSKTLLIITKFFLDGIKLWL